MDTHFVLYFTMFKFMILVFVLVVLGRSAKLPKNFKKCNRAKTDFGNCFMEAVQDAVSKMTRPYKEIDLPTLDPLEITEINLEISQNKVSVKQKLTNCNFYGFDKVELKFVNLDFENKILKLDGLYPQIKSECDYEVSGKIIILPIQGQGNVTATTKNFDLDTRATFSETLKNGKTYMHFDNITIDATVDNIHFQVNNLFNGDKALGDRMNEFLNEHSKELFDEVKSDYLKFASEIFSIIVNRVFSKISMEDAFDD